MDLISRQAVLDAINSGMLTDDDTQFECPSECNSMLEWAVNAVKELPTAEPELSNNSPKVENENGDLISRQAAIKQILLCENHDIEHDFEFNEGLIVAMNAIEELPTAEPRKGKWIPVTNGRGGHECDQCHEYAPSWQTGEERLTNYCPNCGARMEESDE